MGLFNNYVTINLLIFWHLPTICNAMSQIGGHLPQTLRNAINFLDHSVTYFSNLNLCLWCSRIQTYFYCPQTDNKKDHVIYSYRKEANTNKGHTQKSILCAESFPFEGKMSLKYFQGALRNEGNFNLPTYDFFVTPRHKLGLTYLPQKRYVIIE